MQRFVASHPLVWDEEWKDMGSTMTSLVQLAFGIMDMESWIRLQVGLEKWNMFHMYWSVYVLTILQHSATLSFMFLLHLCRMFFSRPQAEVHAIAGESPFLFIASWPEEQFMMTQNDFHPSTVCYYAATANDHVIYTL